MRFPSRLSALATIALAGACISYEPLAPGDGRLSLEEALGELDVPAIRLAQGAFTTLGAPPPIAPSACTFEPSSESFVCTPLVAGGLTLARSFTLVSASGAKQSAFDRTTTSSIRAAATISGSRLEDGFRTTVEGEQELTVAGLLTNQHTINGASTTRLARVTEASVGEQPLMTTVTTKLKNVVLPLVQSGAPVAWPRSGSMELLTTIFADYPPPRAAPGPIISGAVVVYTGTSIVEAAITDRDGTRACYVNMALAEGVGC